MRTEMEMFAALAAPFQPERVSWRVGSTTKDKARGLALAYIDARDVYDRLDAVVGPGDWQCRYSRAEKTTICEIGIKVGNEWVWKANGAGDSDIEAEKGALSDAVKRAAVVWGIGRYLYDIDSPWVEIESFGNSHKIKDSERPKLIRALSGAKAAAVPVQAPSSSPPSSISQRAETARRAPAAAAKPIPDDPRFMSGDPASVRKRLIDAVNKQVELPALNKLVTQTSWLEQIDKLPDDDKTDIDLVVDARRSVLSNLLPAG